MDPYAGGRRRRRGCCNKNGLKLEPAAPMRRLNSLSTAPPGWSSGAEYMGGGGMARRGAKADTLAALRARNDQRHAEALARGSRFALQTERRRLQSAARAADAAAVGAAPLSAGMGGSDITAAPIEDAKPPADRRKSRTAGAGRKRPQPAAAAAPAAPPAPTEDGNGRPNGSSSELSILLNEGIGGWIRHRRRRN